MAEQQPRWYGPRALTKVRQVCIPIALLRELELDVGSELQFAIDPDKREIRIREFGASTTSGSDAVDSDGDSDEEGSS